MPVPAQCTDLENTIADLEETIARLNDDLAGNNLPPNEPRPNSEQKALIGIAIGKAEADLARARRDFDDCVRRNTPPPPADTAPALQIPVTMVTQSIQTGDNRIRLIRNRQTAVRVFVDSGVSNGFNAGNGPNRWPGVTGDVQVTDLDTGNVSGFVQPFNTGGAVTARPKSQLSLDNGSHSLNFRLPQSVLSGRRLEIAVRVWVRGHFGAPGGWTTAATTTVELLDRPRQEVTPLLIVDMAAGVAAPTFATYIRILRRGALARLPVPSFAVNRPIIFPVGHDLTSVIGWGLMMAGLVTVEFIGLAAGGIRTGVLGPGPAPRPVGGMGLPRIGFTHPTFVSELDEDAFAHEMGHTHGLNHAVCRGDEPWLHDDRLPAHTDEVGMHIEDGIVIRRGAAELMSYCSTPKWPSQASYDLIFDNPA
jgi:hypothetical protein